MWFFVCLFQYFDPQKAVFCVFMWHLAKKKTSSRMHVRLQPMQVHKIVAVRVLIPNRAISLHVTTSAHLVWGFSFPLRTPFIYTKHNLIRSQAAVPKDAGLQLTTYHAK